MKTTGKTKRPKPPEDLDGEGLLEWHRAVDELDDAGRLEKTDRAALTLYAETWALWHEARRVLRSEKIVKEYTANAGLSPSFKAVTTLQAQLRGLMNDLGLTPVSRAKVRGTADDGAIDF